MRAFAILTLTLCCAVTLALARYYEGAPGGRRAVRGAGAGGGGLPLAGGGGGGQSVGPFRANRFRQERFYNPQQNRMYVNNQYQAEGTENLNEVLRLNLASLGRGAGLI